MNSIDSGSSRSPATKIKLDELLRAVEGARNEIARVEELPEQELRELREE